LKAIYNEMMQLRTSYQTIRLILGTEKHHYDIAMTVNYKNVSGNNLMYTIRK